MEEESEEEELTPAQRRKRAVLSLLKDIAFALLVVGIIMGAILAYSQVWPPVVVVESYSMQHSYTESYIGVIDTGDIVLVQRSPNRSDITTYLQGRASGHSTYGDYGDVVVYKPSGREDLTPIIHRTFIYLEWNTTTDSSFDIPTLNTPYWQSRLGVDWGGVNGDGSPITNGYNISGVIWIRDVGYTHKNVTFNIAAKFLRYRYSGYITMGDHNLASSTSSEAQTDRVLVRHEWIVGKARGELPWFGLIKLSLSGQIQWGSTCGTDTRLACAPGNSWSSLVISLVLIFVLPIVLDIGLGYFFAWRERKREEEAVEPAEPPAEEMEEEPEKEEELEPKPEGDDEELVEKEALEEIEENSEGSQKSGLDL